LCTSDNFLPNIFSLLLFHTYSGTSVPEFIDPVLGVEMIVFRNERI
jgi:hypothetical protein